MIENWLLSCFEARSWHNSLPILGIVYLLFK